MTNNPKCPTPGESPALPLPSTSLELHVEDVHKSFGDNPVLRGIDIDLRCGTMLAIVGGSGSGKTVLMRHLIGHFQPDQGRVWVADHESPGSPLTDLATLDEPGLDRLRRHWAVVFQGNALFPDTLFDNVTLVLREVKGLAEAEVRRRAHDAVAAVGLNPDTDMELSCDQLSGGMAKRAGIARALALDPALIFYDEPTSGLDPQLSRQIHELICTVHTRMPESGVPRTSVIITHDKDLLHRLQPRIVMLHHGRVLFDGTFDAFEHSESPFIRPYFEFMPELHQRTRAGFPM